MDPHTSPWSIPALRKEISVLAREVVTVAKTAQKRQQNFHRDAAAILHLKFINRNHFRNLLAAAKSAAREGA
jgi:uncharacterized protein YkuJ